MAHCEFHWITTNYHAPNNITTAFLACIESELGHLAYNVSHDPLNRINMMPSEPREMNETEYAAIIKCQDLVGGHHHFTYQGSRYEDEWTLSSTDISILNTGFDYSTYTLADAGAVPQTAVNQSLVKRNGAVGMIWFETDKNCGGGDHTPSSGDELQCFNSYNLKYKSILGENEKDHSL